MTALLDVNDTAKYLNISKSTLAKMRLSGKSPKYVKLGRKVAYRASDLDIWIEEQTFSSTAEYCN